LKEFLFLEFSNGVYNEQLLQKLKHDEGFRRFVLLQFKRQLELNRGIKMAKNPHPFTI